MEYRVFKSCESGYELVSVSEEMPKAKKGMRVELFDPSTGTTIVIVE